MKARLTRREWASSVALAVSAAPAAAQTQAEVQAPAPPEQAARTSLQETSEALRNFEIPREAEPALTFKAS